jgi:thiopeptide-type bacteriocin biosynthesis protein
MHEPGGAEIASTFKARQEAFASVVNELRQLEKASELDQSFDILCASFVHLHVNRLSGLNALSEQWLLSLLERTREGMQKSPARSEGKA